MSQVYESREIPGLDGCLVCQDFGVSPPGKAVNSKSDDEADWLCSSHRAKHTEGYCVLCGHRPGWMSLHNLEIYLCRPCNFSKEGLIAVRKAEAAQECQLTW